MHTCVFFPLICLACFPSSATASTDRFGDGHFSAEIDLSQAGGYVEKGQNISISNRCKFDRFFRVTTCQQPLRLLHVSSRRRRPASEHVVPVASGQRPNDTSLGASGRNPRAARWARWIRWARWLRWARRARTCMHTCVFFPLICLTCFPSSATASTDRFGDGHFSSEIDLSQAWGVR